MLQMEESQNIQISSDVETKGFDLSAGKTWIYPENYPVRDYQFNIVQASLYSNTLVCLPTGLGKTFIAAVVMYNFWRWYPCGKVVFLAPTKPLVAQQILACHNIMGIPTTETIELTGAVNQKQREVAWSNKRVVFATPQVFHNDLEKNVAPGDLIKCVVIDEAHKALGKHSYCECIRILSEKTQYFRVLALSATPGNKIDNVHQVLQNLHIAHLELKDDTSPDIIPYINQRKVDTVLVPLNNELAEYKERYIFIMDRHVKVLLQSNVLRGQTANISKGRVFHLLKEFQNKSNKSGNYGQIMKTLNILMTMYHAYELMIRDGLRAFHKFYQNHSDKFWMNEETQLQNLLEDIKTYLGPFPDVNYSCEEIADIPQNLVFGHTKFQKLKELLLQHFKNSQEKQDNTRAIVFVEYRDIVTEVYILLLQCRPLVRPQMFVGQAGQKQKQQMKALENFRSNHVNVLISTSIGEEGLDVGEVDLIICFDISQHSPTRLVQRMGRTGRKRDGHIIILVTDGREYETLKSTIARRDSLNNKILNTSNILFSLYQNNPRMIPDIFKPECLKMHINIESKSPITKCRNKKEKSKDSKRKNVRKKISIADDLESQKDKNQFSMMKFFKSGKHEEQESDVLTISNSNTTQNINARNAIKPSDVKILSSDSDAVDFLTLCALRNSEKETDVEENRVTSQLLYIPEFPCPKNFFNFSIPDIKILNCLSTLNHIVPIDRKKNTVNNDKDSASNSDGVNLCTDKYEFINSMKEIDDKYDACETKFEDLLDDTSESNKSDILNTDEPMIDNSNVHSIFEPQVASKQYASADELKIMVENTIDSQSLEIGKFEDILNETSDDSESNTQVEDSRQILIENIATCSNVNFKASTNSLRIDNNDESVGTYLQEAMRDNDSFFVTRQSEISIKQCERKDQSNSRYSDCDKSKTASILSVTQAIHEIARLNVKSDVSKVIDESEDDMFQDEIYRTPIANKKYSKPKVEHSVESKKSNDDIDHGGSTHFNDKICTINTDLKVEDYEWDDDFEIPTAPAQSCVQVNTIKDKRDRLKESKYTAEKQYSDDEDWISVEKSIDTKKRNMSNVSIAKKLSRVKNSWSSNCGYTSRHIENKNDSKNDSVVCEMNESIDCEKSHFFAETRDDSDKCKNPQGITNRLKMIKIRKHNRARKSRKVRNKFIDDEAEVTMDGENTVTDESSETDGDLEGFVSYTQNVHDISEMHAHYLQTVRSPIKKHDGFIFKRPRALDSNVEIYSQPVSQEYETYINDSFCVAGDNEEEAMISRIEELCELEKAEMELERRKRKRGRGETSKSNTRKKTKRTIRRNISYDSSSEDETEKLREQIKDESLLLARS